MAERIRCPICGAVFDVSYYLYHHVPCPVPGDERKTTMSFSELCSAIAREQRAVESFYDDPMTQHYGAYECAPLVAKAARAKVAGLLKDAGYTADSFLDEVERRACSRIAARFEDGDTLRRALVSHSDYAAGYAYACGYHD